jgi:hypothetical protein
MASKLEELGKQFRKDNLIKNDYQKNESGKYSATHPNATSDGDAKGKGTGVNGDTYNGGSDIDINGNPNVPKSGRNQLTSMNQYGPENEYKHPDTDGNEDQFRVS